MMPSLKLLKRKSLVFKLLVCALKRKHKPDEDNQGDLAQVKVINNFYTAL